MLQSLHIRDLALIGHAEVAFAQGLNVLSGATGGGKSLVITALKILRGEKVRGDLVRHGQKELRVDGEFSLGDGERSQALLDRVAEIVGEPFEEESLLVTRIVDQKGRSRVRVAGRPATLSALREIGPWLLEIHGQGESRALMRPEIQAETLDGFAGTANLRLQFAEALRVARAARAAVEEARGRERERLQRIEFLRFQLEEMQGLELQSGEAEELDREHRVLAHQDHLRELMADALRLLHEQENAAGDLVAQAGRALTEAAAIDPSLAEAVDRLQDAGEQMREAVRIAQSRSGALELDPQRLRLVEDRLADVRRALQRFGPSETDFRSTLDATDAELRGLEEGADPEALAAKAQEALTAASRVGKKLLRARRKSVAPFTAAVTAELADLAMEHTEFRVDMEDDVDEAALLDEATAFGPTGLDFAARINPGEPFRSVRDTASGGEMARIVLAIKKTLADQDRVPLLVLDEIDSEIGGRLGLKLGGKLAEVAAHHQLVMVTHLPQVAAFADTHLFVRKHAEADRTWSTVELLDAAGVESELAAMAAGDGDEGTLTEARRLVAKASRSVRPKRGGKGSASQGG